MKKNWLNAGWPIARIRDIGRLHGGGTPSRKRAEFFQGTIPWITGQDIPESHVAEISAARDYVTDEAVQESATRIVPAGTVLVTTRVSVGKTAIAGCPICFSQDVTAILINSGAIALPAYVAYFLRSRREALLQKNQGSTISGITRDSLALEQIPLPSLSEQQRIVEILQEAEEIRRLRAEAEAKTADLIPSMFRELFGETGNNSKNWPVVPISNFVESFQGGKSLAGIEGDFDLSRPRVLKISAVTSGFLVPSESKALPSTYESPEEHYIKDGDLLITRANTEELVGATALVRKPCPANLVLPDKIWRFVWKEGFNGTPEFVWALFQEQATRRALGNISSGTGGSMKNISMKKLMQMRVIWPPKELQESFSQSLREVLDLSENIKGDNIALELHSSLFAYAFSGQLTADWREANKEKLQQEAQVRDIALQEAVGINSRQAFVQIYSPVVKVHQVPTRGNYSELNREQYQLLDAIGRDAPENGGYFTSESLTGAVNGPLAHHPQKIEAHLKVFAARGIILAVSRPRAESTGPAFAACYRLPVLLQRQPQSNNDSEQKDSDDIKTMLMGMLRSLVGDRN